MGKVGHESASEPWWIVLLIRKKGSVLFQRKRLTFCQRTWRSSSTNSKGFSFSCCNTSFLLLAGLQPEGGSQPRKLKKHGLLCTMCTIKLKLMLLGNISWIFCFRKTRFIRERSGGEAACDEHCATTAGSEPPDLPVSTTSVAPTRPWGFESGWYKTFGGTAACVETLAGAPARPLEEPLDRVGEGEGLDFAVSCRDLSTDLKWATNKKQTSLGKNCGHKVLQTIGVRKTCGKNGFTKGAAERTCYRKILQQTAAEVKVNNDQKKIAEQTAAVTGQNICRKMVSQKGLRKENATEKTCGKWLQKLSRKNCWANSCSEWAKYLQENGFTKGAAERKCYRKILRQMAAEVKVNNDQKNCWAISCSESAKYLQENGFTKRGCRKKMLQKKPAANGCGSENYQEKIVEETAAVNGQNICRKMASQKKAAERKCYRKNLRRMAAEVKIIMKKLLSKQLQWMGKISAGKWLHKRGCGKKML